MIPTEVATIISILENSYEMDSWWASKAAWDIYNEFKYRLLPEGMSIDAG